MHDEPSPLPPGFQVVCLCAAWCGVCRDWRPLLEDAARTHPAMQFAWVDVEDEDETMGDVDIETFPTLLIARGRTVHFFGPVAPMARPLARLLATVQAQAQPPSPPPAQATALLQRLEHDGVLARCRMPPHMAG